MFHPLMYRCYMRKSDPEEPPKLEEPLEEREGLKRIKSKQCQEQQDSDEKMLEEKYYRLVTDEKYSQYYSSNPLPSSLDSLSQSQVWYCVPKFRYSLFWDSTLYFSLYL